MRGDSVVNLVIFAIIAMSVISGAVRRGGKRGSSSPPDASPAAPQQARTVPQLPADAPPQLRRALEAIEAAALAAQARTATPPQPPVVTQPAATTSTPPGRRRHGSPPAAPPPALAQTVPAQAAAAAALPVAALRPVDGRPLAGVLGSPGRVRDAIVFAEIFGPPVSLR